MHSFIQLKFFKRQNIYHCLVQNNNWSEHPCFHEHHYEFVFFYARHFCQRVYCKFLNHNALIFLSLQLQSGWNFSFLNQIITDMKLFRRYFICSHFLGKLVYRCSFNFYCDSQLFVPFRPGRQKQLELNIQMNSRYFQNQLR